MGIVVLLMGLSLCLVSFATHDFITRRYGALIFAFVLYTANLILSFAPCCQIANPISNKFKFIYTQVLTILALFIFVIVWYYYIASDEEIKLFFWPLFYSFLYSLIGFIFYRSKFPEKYIKEKKFGKRIAWVCQMVVVSHTLWHIFIVASTYCFLKVYVDFVDFIEKT